MIIKQNAGHTISIICDIPTNTAGVLAYGTPNNYAVAKTGGALAAGGGSFSSAQPGANGPYVASVALANVDVDTLGDLEVAVQDAAGNVIGREKVQVVAFDPEDGVHLGLACLPNANPGASNGVLIAGSNANTTFADGLEIVRSTNVALQIVGSNNWQAVSIVGGGSGNPAVEINSNLGGDGLSVTANAGHGVIFAASGTSKHGLFVTGGTAGISDGIKAVAGTGGADIRGNLTGSVASIGAGGITDSSFTLPSEPTGPATTFITKLMQLWNRFFQRCVNDKVGGTIKCYKADGTTVVATSAYTTSTTTDDVGKAV